MAVTNNLKDIRKKRNLNQEDLAQGTGTCSKSISRIECGTRNASLEVALRMAKYLELSVEDIFQIEDA